MQRIEGQSEVLYRIGMTDKMLGVRVDVLKDAVPVLPAASSQAAPSSAAAHMASPLAVSSQPDSSSAAQAVSSAPLSSASSPTFGILEKGLPMPSPSGAYVVEVVDADTIRPLAYLDPYGRAFTMSEPSQMPPAHDPDLSFVKYTEQSVRGEETGCVETHAQGVEKEVAQFRFARGRYTLFDSWYDFGPHASNLVYKEAMARAYLAFVHRPSLGAPAVPERGLLALRGRLNSEKPLTSLRALVADVQAAEIDPVICPPALMRCLARWLLEAGLHDLDKLGDDALRLVRTARYANTYYLALDEPDTGIAPRTIWALEAAINRFLLVYEAFGDNAAAATDMDCARWDAYLIETVALQRPLLGQLADAPSGAPLGEWEVRCALGAAIERLRLPVRIEVTFRVDVAAGAVGLDMTVPDGSLMPIWVWQDAPLPASPTGGWVQATAEAREQQARRYALHLGLVLVSVAFEASEAIRRVDVVARPLGEAEEKEGEFPVELSPSAYVQAAFDRGAYERYGHFEDARAGDPLPVYQACGAFFDVTDADAFGYVNSLASATLRRELPETCEDPLLEPASTFFGVDDSWGMRINFDAAHRRMAEGLADRIVKAESASDAIRIVRNAQDEASMMMDERAVSSCTRLMAALAEGSLDSGDQNAVVGCFLGEDRCLVALGRARTLAQKDPAEAVRVLIDAVAEAAALDGFVDGATTVYRTFDSYASRVLYNRARAGLSSVPARATEDAGKSVELASDSFYLCHLEIVNLLEHSFERIDEALRFGHRALEIAPTSAAGYSRLGRAYMLVGDMENAAGVLQDGLRIATQPNEIAVAYYQLAYVLWKAGRAQDGAACYLKSISISPVMAVQATAELQELVEETGATIVAREDIDEELEKADLVVSPTAEVLDVLGEGAARATDAGLFPVARNLLAIRLRYRPDDALVNVLRSLEE